MTMTNVFEEKLMIDDFKIYIDGITYWKFCRCNDDDLMILKYCLQLFSDDYD